MRMVRKLIGYRYLDLSQIEISAFSNLPQGFLGRICTKEEEPEKYPYFHKYGGSLRSGCSNTMVNLSGLTWPLMARGAVVFSSQRPYLAMSASVLLVSDTKEFQMLTRDDHPKMWWVWSTFFTCEWCKFILVGEGIPSLFQVCIIDSSTFLLCGCLRLQW